MTTTDTRCLTCGQPQRFHAPEYSDALNMTHPFVPAPSTAARFRDGGHTEEHQPADAVDDAHEEVHGEGKFWYLPTEALNIVRTATEAAIVAREHGRHAVHADDGNAYEIVTDIDGFDCGGCCHHRARHGG